MSKTTEREAEEIARLITASLAGSRWRDMTPLDIAKHLVRNGVRVVHEGERVEATGIGFGGAPAGSMPPCP